MHVIYSLFLTSGWNSEINVEKLKLKRIVHERMWDMLWRFCRLNMFECIYIHQPLFSFIHMSHLIVFVTLSGFGHRLQIDLPKWDCNCGSHKRIPYI
jgi:hypothetical protein